MNINHQILKLQLNSMCIKAEFSCFHLISSLFDEIIIINDNDTKKNYIIHI